MTAPAGPHLSGLEDCPNETEDQIYYDPEGFESGKTVFCSLQLYP